MHHKRNQHHNQNNKNPPEKRRVVLLFEDAGFVANDDAVFVHFLPHVSRVRGAVEREKQPSVAQPMNVNLKSQQGKRLPIKNNNLKNTAWKDEQTDGRSDEPIRLLFRGQ